MTSFFGAIIGGIFSYLLQTFFNANQKWQAFIKYYEKFGYHRLNNATYLNVSITHIFILLRSDNCSRDSRSHWGGGENHAHIQYLILSLVILITTFSYILMFSQWVNSTMWWPEYHHVSYYLPTTIFGEFQFHMKDTIQHSALLRYPLMTSCNINHAVNQLANSNSLSKYKTEY